MKIIKKLSDMIEDEIDGAMCYAKKAVKLKSERPNLAAVLYELSREELTHITRLHNEVVQIIEKYRKEEGEPPEGMKTLYDYLHKKHIEKVQEIKRYQDIYKEI